MRERERGRERERRARKEKEQLKVPKLFYKTRERGTLLCTKSPIKANGIEQRRSTINHVFKYCLATS